MRTTLDLDDRLVREAKKRAAETGSTLTSLIEDGLRAVLTKPASAKKRKLVRLPTAGRGGVHPGVDLTNNAAILAFLDGPDGPR